MTADHHHPSTIRKAAAGAASKLCQPTSLIGATPGAPTGKDARHLWLRRVAWCRRCTTQSVCHCWRWIYHASCVLTWKVCRQLKDLSFLNHGNHMLHSMLLSAHSEQYQRIVHWHTSNVYLALTAVTTLYWQTLLNHLHFTFTDFSSYLQPCICL